jgi:hypothetical protein
MESEGLRDSEESEQGNKGRAKSEGKRDLARACATRLPEETSS